MHCIARPVRGGGGREMKGNYREAARKGCLSRGGGACEMKGNYRVLVAYCPAAKGGGGREMKGNYKMRQAFATDRAVQVRYDPDYEERLDEVQRALERGRLREAEERMDFEENET